MKKNITIALFIVSGVFPIIAMENKLLDERMPKMITKFKRKYGDVRYQIPSSYVYPYAVPRLKKDEMPCVDSYFALESIMEKRDLANKELIFLSL